MTERKATVRLAAGAVEVAFVWDGDRWTHHVRCRGATICTSVEGAWPAGGDPRWPASPALQEVTPAAPGAGAAVLAVGHAGRSHYAASVAVDPDEALAARARKAGWSIISLRKEEPCPDHLQRVETRPPAFRIK